MTESEGNYKISTSYGQGMLSCIPTPKSQLGLLVIDPTIMSISVFWKASSERLLLLSSFGVVDSSKPKRREVARSLQPVQAIRMTNKGLLITSEAKTNDSTKK